jgi:hypothetical protein
MIAVAKGGQANRSLIPIAGAASMLAIVLAVLALPLAINAWPKERRSARWVILLLAVGAVVWSLVVV